MVKNRLDMLSHISHIQLDDNELDVFRDYIPDHYAEVYSLFSFLNDAGVYYKTINFHEPEEKNDSFIFLLSLETKRDCRKLKNHLEKINGCANYLRNTKFNIILSNDGDIISMKFIHSN